MSMNLFRPGGLALTGKAADTIGLQPGDRVLDVGCGLGTSLAFLTKTYGIEPHGVDLHPIVVHRAAEMLGSDRVQVADACALPFEDECFDAVFMECVLTLATSPQTALQEAARVLKPGGSLIISSLDGAYALCEHGRIGKEALMAELGQLQLTPVLCTDETADLRRFVAHAIFQYGSLEAFIDMANQELGGCILNCDVPASNTGYLLVVAKRRL